MQGATADSVLSGLTMSQRKVYVSGTAQPGLNANFRKSGFCGSMNTPQETKAILDMLDKERWAIPFDHIFYREGVDEENPPENHKMEGDDVMGDYIGGILTEKGDTVLVAELDGELDVVKTMFKDMEEYRDRISAQIAKGVPHDQLEKPPYGFSPQASLVFTNEDGVTDKDFKNISIVRDPEYGAEGAYVHAIGHNKEDILRDIASNLLSKDAYVSPEFGSVLWSYRSDARPPSSYTPKVMIPIEDDDDGSDPMDATATTEEKPDASPEEDDGQRKEREDNQSLPKDDPMPIDDGEPLITEKAEQPADARAVNVFSSHGKSDSSTPTDAKPPISRPDTGVTVPQTTGQSPSSVSSAPTKTTSVMSQNEAPVTGDAEQKQSPPVSNADSPPPATSPNPPSPKRTASPSPLADESKDVEMGESVPPEENRAQQRAKSAEAAEDFFKRAQQRQRDMNTIKTDSERLTFDAERILSEMDTNDDVIDFSQVGGLLKRLQDLEGKISDLNLNRKETPINYSIATAKAYDVLNRWNASIRSAAEKKDMQDELPKDMDEMLQSPKVLQANQQLLRVFSKSLRGTSSSAASGNRINQREIEKRAEEVRRRKQQQQPKKRPREDDSYMKQPSTPIDEKKRKVEDHLVELPRSTVLQSCDAPLMTTIFSSRRNHDRDFVRAPKPAAITKSRAEIRDRWIKLAVKGVFNM